MGEKLGMSGKELKDWVTEEMNKERDERAAQRENERIKAEVEIAQANKDVEIAKANANAGVEKAKVEKDAEIERAKVEKDAELEKAKLKKETDIEQQKLEQEYRLQQQKQQLEHDKTTDKQTKESKSVGKSPKLPMFVDGTDDIDSYLERFERFAKIQNWDPNDWAIMLSALLSGTALDVYARLSSTEALDYDIVKGALLKRYNLTEEGFRSKFRTSSPDQGENPSQFITRIRMYMKRWMEMAEVKTYEALQDLIIREQFMDICNKELAMYLKEKQYISLGDMCKQAERFLEAHNKNFYYYCIRQGRQQYKTEIILPSQRDRDNNTIDQRQGIECFNCHKFGHVRAECRNKDGGNEQQCAACKLYGHVADVCRNTKTVAATMQTRYASHLPRRFGTQLKTLKGKVGEHIVDTLRDSGCDSVCVNRRLVMSHQMTGDYKVCKLVDGTEQKLPTALVDVDTPYLRKCNVVAVCLDEPVFDLIIGDVDGAVCKCNPDTTWSPEDMPVIAAVSTRAQTQAEKKPVTPLRVTDAQTAGIEVTPDVLKQLQQEDVTLNKIQNYDADKKKMKDEKVAYECRNGIWFRQYRANKETEPVDQLVVPASLRYKIMCMAHECLMGGHLGIKKTKDKVQASFYWPGINGDITRFCRSCDICQRTIEKGKVPKVHLGNMPVIDIPFKRVAIDIVGPIFPPSDRKNRYILTMVDYATRYPEAVPLKDVTTETVAEALVNMFSRLGVPEEVLSDQGAQFTSSMMKEVSRLLSIQQLVTSPYHPMANGLCEKFNGTLKQMLKKLCKDNPKDWDRYINPALFAYREAPQESTGYAPFELLYGRTVRGPLQILKQLWTKEIHEPDIKTSYQYVIDLRERLESSMGSAIQALRSSKTRYKKYYDRKARARKFKTGGKVLILLPTDRNKLLMQWEGPYLVKEALAQNNYKVKVKGREKTYHANLLKEYVDREDTSTNAAHTGVIQAAIIESSDGGIGDVVDDEGLLELHYRGGKESYADVCINGELSEDQQSQITTILESFSDVLTEVPGRTNLVEHKIPVTSDVPVRSRPYPIPYTCRESLQKEIDEMLKIGIIEKAETPYSSPVVVVNKKDGSKRVCVDYRKLNKVSIFDGEPTAVAEDIFAKVSADRYFSTIDLSKGYWQIPVASTDISKTGFVTPDGCYVFRRMPFGLMNSAATFNRMMRKLLDGIENVDNYIDDICIHTKNWEDHMAVFIDVMDRIRQAGLTVRPSKCKVGFSKVEFLGHYIGKGEKELHPANVEKVLQAHRPETKKAVRSFLGLTGYYRSYIPQYATIAAPLSNLTKKGCPQKVVWRESQERAFMTLKKYLTSKPVLRLPDMDKSFILRTDASNSGVGAVLMQEHEGELHPISYASKKLSERETRYSTMERECLALVWAVKKFQVYLYGKNFVLQTDHQPLAYLNRCKVENQRIMRWAMFLQAYSISIEAIKGVDNVGADYMSRI